MDDRIVNVLVAGIPTSRTAAATMALPVLASATVDDLWTALHARLPPIQSRLLLTTLSNREVPAAGTDGAETCVASLAENFDFLSLRLSLPVLGGKGGFGSQLRAAGGRMASRKKKGTHEEENASSRNLDGRRLRTVAEAKALAAYLAIKPDMDRKEKEARRKRWEQIVEMAEKKEDAIKHGTGSSGSRLDGKWVEAKDEANERTRAAVQAAMKGAFTDVGMGLALSTSAGSNTSVSGSGSESAEEESEEGEEEEEEDEDSEEAEEAEAKTKAMAAVPTAKDKGKGKVFFAFDEDDEFMSSDDEE